MEHHFNDNLSERRKPFNSSTAESARLILRKINVKRPSLSQFEDVFPKEEIRDANQYVERVKKRINDEVVGMDNDFSRELAQNSKDVASALEIIVGSQIELYDWLGENSMFTQTTEYDDLKNKIDAVVEFNTDGDVDRLALVIDATMGSDQFVMEGKVNRNITKLLNNSSEVKFFQSQMNDFKGTLKNCVSVVVGFDGSTSKRLIDDFADLLVLENKTNKDKNDHLLIKQKKEKITKNPAQIILIEEIRLQLGMYKNIIKREKNPAIKVTIDQIDTLLNLTGEILQEKEGLVDDEEVDFLRTNDNTYGWISYYAKKYSVAS